MFKEISENLYAIFPSDYSCNCYVINGKKLTLIDSGLKTAEKEIKSCLSSLGFSFNDVELILHTHGHADHFSADFLFPNAEIWMHESDAKRVGIKDSSFTVSHWFKENYFPSIKNFFKSNQIFDLGEYKLQCLHTPGHTAGSTCFHCLEKNILFSGDTLFDNAFGRYDLPSGNKEDLIKTLSSLKQLDFEILCPGHNTIRESMQKENIQFCLQRLNSGL